MLQVQFDCVGLRGAFHDELETRRGVLAHELAEDPVGFELPIDHHAQGSSAGLVESRLSKLIGCHFTKALETADVDFGVPRRVRNDPVALRVVESPVHLLSNVARTRPGSKRKKNVNKSVAIW